MVKNKDSLIEIVGKDNIYDDLETLSSYSQDNSFVQPRKPQLVIKPRDTDEIHKIVKWANQTNTPVVPISSGPPRFYGDTVPSVEGTVIVDLGRLKKIIRIHRRTRMTIIEPGVTYSELQPELAKNGLRLSTPLLPRPNKSVVASLLERQPTIVPKYQWTLPEPLRCLEVVWGNGYKFMTGEAGEQVVDTLEEQWELGLAQMTAMGPGQVDYHRLISAAQGTMGIVTWATIKCEILPQIHKLFLIPSEKLESLIDCAYQILKYRLGDEFLLLNRTDLAILLSESPAQIEKIKDQLPPWVIIIGIAGRDVLPKDRLDFQEHDIRDVTQQFGLELVSSVPGAHGEEVLDAILNPSKEPYWKLRHKGGCQDIFFLTTLEKMPRLIDTMYTVADACEYPRSAIGIYLQPQQQGVSCHCEFNLPYDPDDKNEENRVRELLTMASSALMKEDAFFSRPYNIWADMVYNKDAQTTDVLKKIKSIFDPNNIMNPGKLCY